MQKIVLFVVSVGAFLFLSGCAGSKLDLHKPKVTFRNIQLTAMASSTVRMQLVLQVENPNAFPLAVSSAEYSLQIRQRQIFEGKSDSLPSIAATGTTFVTLPIELQWNKFRRLVPPPRIPELPYRALGNMSVELPVEGTTHFPLELEAFMPIPRRIEIGTVVLNHLPLSDEKYWQGTLQFPLSNPNTVDATIVFTEYSYQLDGKEWVNQNDTFSFFVHAKNKVLVDLPFRIDKKTIPVLNAENNNSLYVFAGKATLICDELFFDNATLIFNQKGAFVIQK